MSYLNELDQEERKAFNNLAREQLIFKLLADIRFDMEVCRIEGWNYKELPMRIKNEMENILK